ncbi:1,4-dihydroxy-6-naphthoate synthase [Salininema proteolyticum]|uniref:1,4-dihydroxy-6-naphtoate synthase n=1 Tax=Salininema proteolyticum TaxID=1607685 RepID=A0ABV8TXH2_9ACTN
MSLRFAHSPCPNDTFIFHAWTHGLVDGPDVAVSFADIDITNDPERRDPSWNLMKVSYGNLARLYPEWRLLPNGGALGHDCGPLLLRRRGAGLGGRLAVPSLYSTAYALFTMWNDEDGPEWDAVDVVPFDEIMPRVASGEYDAGLVIHEARFTYGEWGLERTVDLGQWWEAATGVPIPLGAIVARREIDPAPITAAIGDSLRHAWADPSASASYIAANAQEMDPEVCRKHIDLYVNEFSLDLGDKGKAAIERLFTAMGADSRALGLLSADLAR